MIEEERGTEQEHPSLVRYIFTFLSEKCKNQLEFNNFTASQQFHCNISLSFRWPTGPWDPFNFKLIIKQAINFDRLGVTINSSNKLSVTFDVTVPSKKLSVTFKVTVPSKKAEEDLAQGDLGH